MAATTLKINPHDSHDNITIEAGGTPGTKGINVVIDDTKFTNQAQVSNALRMLAERVADKWPLPAS